MNDKAKFSPKWDQLQEWYTTPLGEEYAAFEMRTIERMTSLVFGYYMLELGMPWLESPVETGPIRHRIHLDLPGGNSKRLPSLSSDLENLPFAEDSLDAVLLGHALEYADRPHQILREVDRALIPEGHVLIAGFNPFSLWGAPRLWANRSKRAPWNARFLGVSRLRDWLKLLGYEVRGVEYGFYGLPVQSTAVLNKQSWMDKTGSRFWPRLGGGYVILARKKVTTLTPIKPSWRARRAVLSPEVAPPVSSNYHRNRKFGQD